MSKTYSQVYSEAKVLYREYRGLGFTRSRAREQVSLDLNKRYAKDGKILAFLLKILPYLLLFL